MKTLFRRNHPAASNSVLPGYPASLCAVILVCCCTAGTGTVNASNAESADGAEDIEGAKGVEGAESIENIESAPVEEVTIYGRRTSDPLSFTFDAEQLQGVAGIQNDAVSAIVTLPGVSVLNDFDTDVAIRGSRPESNRYYLDFLPVGYVFHLTGLSVVDSDVVNSLNLHGAGFGVQFQGVTGGVIDITTRDPVEEGFAGVIDASILDAGVLFEGAISDSQRAFFSARGSYYDALLGDIIKESREDDNEGVDIVQLPQYRDYRGRYQIDFSENLKLDLFADGATDKVAFLFDDTAAGAKLDPVTTGNHRFDIEYNRIGAVLNATNTENEKKFQVGIVSLQRLMNNQQGNVGNRDNKLTEETLRSVYNFSNLGRHQISVGGNMSAFTADYNIAARDNGCTEFDVDCRFINSEILTTESTLQLNQFNFFIQDQFLVTDKLNLNLGLGFTGDNYLNDDAVEPRIRLDYSILPNLSLSLSAGRYYEIPPFEYIEQSLGNNDLKYIKSNHYVAGINTALPFGMLLSIDVYRKSIYHLVTSDPAARYDNKGEGNATGIDVMLQQSIGPWSGWVSLSLARAEREDSDTGNPFPFEYDQPVMASLVLKRTISDQLTLGARVSFTSGSPTTPILGAHPDTDNPELYNPIYGDINSDRLPNYFRADLRADWKLKPEGDTSIYFEVVNATNRKNVMAYEYSQDYSQRKNITQLPFLVSFGVRVEI